MGSKKKWLKHKKRTKKVCSEEKILSTVSTKKSFPPLPPLEEKKNFLRWLLIRNWLLRNHSFSSIGHLIMKSKNVTNLNIDLMSWWWFSSWHHDQRSWVHCRQLQMDHNGLEEYCPPENYIFISVLLLYNSVQTNFVTDSGLCLLLN